MFYGLPLQPKPSEVDLVKHIDSLVRSIPPIVDGVDVGARQRKLM